MHPDEFERILLLMARTVAVDFDGTLHPYTRGWQGPDKVDPEPPTEGAREFLEWCKAQGLEVVVFSTRATDEIGHAAIWRWLGDQELDHLVQQVTHVKPPAFAYVDDRAVVFDGDWAMSQAGVESLLAARH